MKISHTNKFNNKWFTVVEETVVCFQQDDPKLKKKYNNPRKFKETTNPKKVTAKDKTLQSPESENPSESDNPHAPDSTDKLRRPQRVM